MAVSRSPFMLRVLASTVRQVFPKVKQLDTDALASWIKDEETDNFVILDVREKNEYTVSHLPKAISINPEASAKEVMAKINEKAKRYRDKNNMNIVTYCSVGMRASIMAQRINEELKRMKEDEEGMEADQKGKISINVFNLEGSIFLWTNEGKPLVDNNEQDTQYCHPFSFLWGFMIPRKTRKY